MQALAAGQRLAVQQDCKRIQTVAGAVHYHARGNARVPIKAAASQQRERRCPSATLPRAVWLRQQQHRRAQCLRLRALQVEAPSEGEKGPWRSDNLIVFSAAVASQPIVWWCVSVCGRL